MLYIIWKMVKTKTILLHIILTVMINNIYLSFKNNPSALLILFMYVFFSPVVCGQVPQGIPKGNGPIDFSSPANIIIYIVLPIIVLIAFFFWRSSFKRRKNENDKDI